MDLVGEFHKLEIDGKPYLVYHNIMKPLPQIHTPNSSPKIAIDSGDNLPLQPLFFCPTSRTLPLLELLDDNWEPGSEIFLKFDISPLFDDTNNGHHVLPLFWCNNKEADPKNECYACLVPKVGTDYYFCVECDKRYHKECIESPLEINYPYHLKHSLQLYLSQQRFDHCIFCRKEARGMVYYCALCDIFTHILCAEATIPFLIDHPKSHDHTLTLFPRQAILPCNVCALVNKLHLTYVCPICDFVAHRDCIYIPQTIRISRHHHRISFISSLSFKEASCGVCRREVDSDYGAYTCNVCCGYAVHTRCALRTDIWDGKELEGIPEEDDTYENVEPFKRIADGIILHFSHDHHLRFETSGVYDESMPCQACALPIYEGSFYVCVECDFIIHEACASAPRIKLHPLHPHPLILEAVHDYDYMYCSECTRISNGFTYVCIDQYCDYQLDVWCALVSEPFKYQGHQHPLFLALDPKEKPMCHICKSTGDHKVINCIECDFIICFKCATLPYTVKYKHDEHYLTFCHGDEASGSDWCELCEGKLAIGGKEGFYKCNDCCTTLHISCLLGNEPYLKYGQTFRLGGDGELLILRNNFPSRPICILCHRRCMYPIFFAHGERTMCSIKCGVDHSFFR